MHPAVTLLLRGCSGTFPSPWQLGWVYTAATAQVVSHPKMMAKKNISFLGNFPKLSCRWISAWPVVISSALGGQRGRWGLGAGDRQLGEGFSVSDPPSPQASKRCGGKEGERCDWGSQRDDIPVSLQIKIIKRVSLELMGEQDEVQIYQYKIQDKNVTFFARGLSAAVL